jgi:hypothetical protein
MCCTWAMVRLVCSNQTRQAGRQVHLAGMQQVVLHVNQPYCTMLAKTKTHPRHACEDVVAAGMRCCRVLCAATDRGRVGRCDTLERSGHLAPPHGYCRLVTREPQSRTKCKVSEKLHTHANTRACMHGALLHVSFPIDIALRCWQLAPMLLSRPFSGILILLVCGCTLPCVNAHQRCQCCSAYTHIHVHARSRACTVTCTMPSCMSSAGCSLRTATATRTLVTCVPMHAQAYGVAWTINFVGARRCSNSHARCTDRQRALSLTAYSFAGEPSPGRAR